MTSLLHRAATGAGLAVSGFSTFAQAQDSVVYVPPPTQLRRALPVAAAPIIQQSPNGLYKMSITDAGIELRGPSGVVKITDAGIVIGQPNTPRVEIHSGEMTVRAGQNVRLESGSHMQIRSATTMDLRSQATMDLRGSTVQMTTGAASVKLDAGASLLGQRVNLGCPSGKPAARVGDIVNPTVTPPVIVQGSPTVLAC